MKKIGIACDAWKLSVFEKHLTEAGYTYEKVKLGDLDAYMLKVEAHNAHVIAPIVRAAEAECRRMKAN